MDIEVQEEVSVVFAVTDAEPPGLYEKDRVLS